LVACGGGGDGGPGAPVVAPPTSYVEPQAVTQVPAGAYSDVWRLSAFNRLNEVRAQAGIGLLRQNVSVDQAAQNHSSYQVNHGKLEHTESAGGADFTGDRTDSRIPFITNPSYVGLVSSTPFCQTICLP
jgi:Cysteine-rich secretory protein family